MSGLFFDRTGPKVQFFHEEDDNYYISSHLNVRPLLDANAEARNHGTAKFSEFRRVASIDPVTYMEWCRQDGINIAHFMRWPRDEKVKYLKRKIADIDNYKFRTVDKL